MHRAPGHKKHLVPSILGNCKPGFAHDPQGKLPSSQIQVRKHTGSYPNCVLTDDIIRPTIARDITFFI